MKSVFGSVIAFVIVLVVVSCSNRRTIVQDEVNILTPTQRDSVETLLNGLEQRTGTQMGIFIVQSLQGRLLADVSAAAFQKSGLADAPGKDGVLIVMAMEDRQMRIEVGPALKHVLDDERCDQIILKTMLPHYIRGKLFIGLMAGLNELVGIVEAEKVNAKK